MPRRPMIEHISTGNRFGPADIEKDFHCTAAASAGIPHLARIQFRRNARLRSARLVSPQSRSSCEAPTLWRRNIFAALHSRDGKSSAAAMGCRLRSAIGNEIAAREEKAACRSRSE